MADVMEQKVVIAIGSNLSDRYSHLQKGVNEWRKIASIRIIAISHLYENPPEGKGFDQDFYNGVIVLDTNLGALDLLKTCKEIESVCGRDNSLSPDEEKRNRPLDCDVIFYGDEEFGNKSMVVPHPRWSSRPFVVIPLLDVIESLTDWQKGKVKLASEELNYVENSCERIQNMLDY